MAIVALPDVSGGLMLRLRSFSAITALTSMRIATQRGADWFPDNTTRYAILINGPIGSPGDDGDCGIQRTRFDLVFYGPGTDGREAMLLWRTAHPLICPRQDSVVQFTSGGVRFRNVRKEGGPTRLEDPDTGWVFVLATYLWDWSEFPA